MTWLNGGCSAQGEGHLPSDTLSFASITDSHPTTATGEVLLHSKVSSWMVPSTMTSVLTTLLQRPENVTQSYTGPHGETGGGSCAHLLAAALLLEGSIPD